MSRRSWILIFDKHGKTNKSKCWFQIPQHENRSIFLDNLKMYNQRLDLYVNPVRAGFVREPQEWLSGSAIDYYMPDDKYIWT